jgi:hypothetical protein
VYFSLAHRANPLLQLPSLCSFVLLGYLSLAHRANPLLQRERWVCHQKDLALSLAHRANPLLQPLRYALRKEAHFRASLPQIFANLLPIQSSASFA